MSQEQESPPANRVKKAEGRTETNRPEEKKAAEEVPSVMPSDPDLRLTHITPEQIQDVNKMVDYAVRRGLELPPDMLRILPRPRVNFLQAR